MALIVQKPNLTIDGEERDPGWVVPKRVENDPSNSFGSLLRRGSVIAIPDELVKSYMEFSETVVDLDKNVPEIEEDVKCVQNKDRLDELHAEEARGKDRQGVYKVLEARRCDL